MSKKINYSQSAFSLIELSIVILIIGILVAGVTQSSRLVRQIRIQTARNLTNSSPVLTMKDLNLWLETSSDKSFDESVQSNGSAIAIWYDYNVTVDKNNATSPNATNYPQYVENVFNSSLPAVRFDGINDFFNFNGAFLLNNNFTFIIVEQRRSAGNNQYFIGGAVTGNFHLGYSSSTVIRVGKYGAINSDFFDYGIPAYSSPIPRIHTFTHNSVSGKKYWLNGGTNPDASSANTSALTVFNAAIGQTESNLFYSGDIAEIIVFSRDLKTDERMAIEDYLAKKYSILIS